MGESKRIYIETYGCQMNLADSEIVLGIMKKHGYSLTDDISKADVILVNTCSVREHAEQRVIGRLSSFLRYKKRKPDLVIGVLGCMAERLKKRLIEEENLADIVVGPDEYRKLPQLVNDAFAGHKGIAVKLSKVETYDDITPLRTEGISAWITVMRGCDKFCTFCVVPFTRGRERSRPLDSIVKEVEMLSSQGYREVTLLGQNVNSYRDGNYDFADLLSAVAQVDRNMRIRFTTSHPKDMSNKLIQTIAEHPNICNYIHLPVQSGSDRILELMNRTYDRKHYLELVRKIRETIPGVSLSTDIIAGFPTETEEDHKMTLSLLEEVRFDGAFMFKYSPREGTKAYAMGDDVPDEVKVRRLMEIIELQQKISYEINQGLIGKEVEVLVEGESKRSSEQWMGRTDTNKVVIFPKHESVKPGDYVIVRINKANSATLFGDIVKILHEKNLSKNSLVSSLN
ncbi:tRNA-2-methylthio-N6-dimethylallyladenosine synthase [Candidatus Thermokryptus mobilis]|uniref:tRNA-2-methylthio-N(6)-dimethylallyladenosine synthase n=1 Tax=Candidatus Thermokryptus mobilis TaxID=1643428 RepID=A0A0S4MVB1_9BACT|nr:tRNA (N6-isopentenyl adenosine(37)-C2)-methylthiotransferase MiaB [Candidatus Thermokryptus mobilis]CUU01729.1 tRNA-2-methylthio-N6-dimethylallyladenosine synthase [Candidatus Thermokryptus mobilis]